MESLFNSLKAFFQEYGFSRTYWIAYSGGLDSRVLLQLCVVLRTELPLKLQAVYVNHGLSPNAAIWAEHCENTCRALQVDFQYKTINAKPEIGESPEEAARLGRYAVFAELLAPDDLLLTAHQQDDQAETLLLQLFRGAGPKGLAAMPKAKPFAKGLHLRPLLDYTRQDLEEYAKVHGLQWIEDESNLNTHFTRNFLRHDIVPMLKKRWPTVIKTLARAAENCAEAVEIMEDIAQKDLLESVDIIKNKRLLSVTKLAALSPARQRQVLRAFIYELKFPLPSAVKLKQIQHDFLQAREDKLPCMQWGNAELRRYNDYLYLMHRLLPHDALAVFYWDMQQPLTIPGVGDLHVTKNISQDKQVIVRFRQVGEVCQLPGRKHHHELKKLFQLWKIPPWERDRVPLVFLEDQLIAVAGYINLSPQYAFTLQPK